MLACMSTFVVVAINCQSSEISSSELEELAEEAESVTLQNRRRVRRKNVFSNSAGSDPIIAKPTVPVCRFFKPANERDNLNGIGSYQRV